MEELQVKLNNEFAMREITQAKNQNLEEKVKELSEETQIILNKMNELEKQNNQLEDQLIHLQ